VKYKATAKPTKNQRPEDQAKLVEERKQIISLFDLRESSSAAVTTSTHITVAGAPLKRKPAKHVSEHKEKEAHLCI
jgi:hypothetical protein